MVFATPGPRPSSGEAMTTDAPAPANTRAQPSPMPCVPPVMITVLPEKSIRSVYLLRPSVAERCSVEGGAGPVARVDRRRFERNRSRERAPGIVRLAGDGEGAA